MWFIAQFSTSYFVLNGCKWLRSIFNVCFCFAKCNHLKIDSVNVLMRFSWHFESIFNFIRLHIIASVCHRIIIVSVDLCAPITCLSHFLNCHINSSIHFNCISLNFYGKIAEKLHVDFLLFFHSNVTFPTRKWTTGVRKHCAMAKWKMKNGQVFR